MTFFRSWHRGWFCFIREAEIDRAGCFAYSPVSGATANDLPNPLPVELREERRVRFMEVAEAVSASKLHRRVGSIMQILVDSAPGMGKRGGVGRSYADAPEIDGVVRLLPPEKIRKRSRWVNSPGRASWVRRVTIWLLSRCEIICMNLGNMNFMQTTKKPLKKSVDLFSGF